MSDSKKFTLSIPMEVRDRASSQGEQRLHKDIHLLEKVFQQVVNRYGGSRLVDLWSHLLDLTRESHISEAAKEKLRREIASLDQVGFSDILRSLMCSFDLMNLAEDQHRVRVLRQRERADRWLPRDESIAAAIQKLIKDGVPRRSIARTVRNLRITPVFTAHPTEAKRRTIRRILRRIREDILTLSRRDLLPRERKQAQRILRINVDMLWETDSLRPHKPTVLEEAQRSLVAIDSVWIAAPRLMRDARESLGEKSNREGRIIEFASWIGGDRDGNPFCDAATTRATLSMLRREAIERHIGECDALAKLLTLSERFQPIGHKLETALQAAYERWPQFAESIAEINPNAKYRQWLQLLRHRLEASFALSVDDATADGTTTLRYHSAEELAEDVKLVHDSLVANGHTAIASGPVEDWLDRISIFGFHLQRLDIRDDAAKLTAVTEELLTAAGLLEASSSESVESKGSSDPQYQLAELLGDPAAIQRLAEVELSGLSEVAQDLIAVMELAGEFARESADNPLGAVIISMCHSADDVFRAMLLLAVGSKRAGKATVAPLRIAPLYETVDALGRAPEILSDMLSCDAYRKQVEMLGGQQLCMIGYSDSAKDGGYLTANWRLYDGQRRLIRAAEQLGVDVYFFHGRGGSIGRGGGPAARSILSLPPGAVKGRMRLTEQGEMIAERFDDPEIAYRHLEQLTYATLLGSAGAAKPQPDEFVELLSSAAERSYRVYRDLVETDGFVDYFRQATPIEVIESLQIGSRPSRRRSKNSLKDLRAIPYTFAWTQSRHMVTGFFGLGAGFEELQQNDQEQLCNLYRDWPFFAALIDNAELALIRYESSISHAYSRLLPDQSVADTVWGKIDEEFRRTLSLVLGVKQQPHLLAGTNWLLDSFTRRIDGIDLANTLQLELLKRKRNSSDAENSATLEELDYLLRLSVQTIATGLRNTG